MQFYVKGKNKRKYKGKLHLCKIDIHIMIIWNFQDTYKQKYRSKLIGMLPLQQESGKWGSKVVFLDP